MHDVMCPDPDDAGSGDDGAGHDWLHDGGNDDSGDDHA